MFENYKPSEEDISKAEASMTDEQRVASHIREEGFALGQQSVREENQKESLPDPEVFQLPVSVIKMEDKRHSARFLNILNDAGIFTINDLIQKSELDLLRLKGFGRKMLNFALAWLRENKLELRKDTPSDF